MAKGNKGGAVNAAELPINQGRAAQVGEIRDTMSAGQPEIEVIEGNSDAELRRIMADESFMNEIVTIRVATTTDKNAPPMAMPAVNGVNQPIFRGVPTMVKRKYVEALARARETTYQQVADPASPDKITMVPNTVLSFPFEVLQDQNPKGRAWLEKIMAEPA